MPLAAPDMPRVLIVDDVALNLIVGQSLAEALGYRVQTACDGLQAIEACKREAPHVVLMDMEMPRLNGIDAIRHLRLLQKEGSIPPFPIMVVTAGRTPRIRIDCLEAGADACLEKPMTLESMAQELARVASYR
jgi:CheY-like chemotaxis protein